jgi:hypothetical protein
LQGDVDEGNAAGSAGAQDLREVLKQRSASYRQDDEDLIYEEVPQPPSDDEDRDEEDLQDAADA